MNERGFILLHREVLDNPVVCIDAEYLAVWVLLLLRATHTEVPKFFNYQKITLKPGQLITGRKRIAEQLKISESKVDRILKKYEKEQQIERLTSKQNTLITIVNWARYQRYDQQNEQTSNNNRTTNEQQMNTNNNGIMNNTNHIYKQREQAFDEQKKELYGSFRNVFLTADEYQKIKDLKIESLIESLSIYQESSGKHYKNHYATIIGWSRKNKGKVEINETNKRTNEQKSKFGVKPTISIKPIN